MHAWSYGGVLYGREWDEPPFVSAETRSFGRVLARFKCEAAFCALEAFSAGCQPDCPRH